MAMVRPVPARQLHRDCERVNQAGEKMFAEFLAVRGLVKIALCRVAALAAITLGTPGFSAEATATASAMIVTPITISNAANLSFGNFDASSTGTITVNTAGVRTASGVRLTGGRPTAAAFTVTGQSGLSYNITYAGTSPALSNGTDTLDFTIVSDLGGAATSAGTPVSSATLGAGSTTLRIGGVLTVSTAGTSPGNYTGTIAATVQYQ
jgi:spore coat protein U-like protein